MPSRKSVPPAASSIRPSLRSSAPGNAPRSCPNNSLSSIPSASEAQPTSTNGPLRPDIRCSMCATSSFPVPDSPVMSTGESLGATRAIISRTALERRVLRLDLRGATDALELRLEQDVLAREATLLPRATHEHVDLGHAIRLRHVVVRAELHRADGRLDGAVARDDDDLGRVGFGAYLLQHLEPVELGHHDVEQRDVVRFGAQRFDRGASIGDGANGAAATAQEVRQDLTEVHFVLGHEHLDLRLAHVRSPLSIGAREHDAKHAPLSRCAVHLDAAAVLGDDRVADRQPEPRAAAGRLGRVEWFEDLGQVGAANPLTVIDHFGDDVLRVVAPSRAQLDRAPLAHRVHARSAAAP